MFRIEHNVETNEVTQIELTGAELKEWEKATAKAEAEQAAFNAEAEAKAAAKAELLAKLGITEDEAKLLLG